MIDFTKKIHNSDKFRQPALTYIRTGQYCQYPKGTSEYMSYWSTEQDRCINGYTADDGDFISGYNYFYLNYCPILRIVNKEVNGKIKPVSEVTFPDFWDYDYYYFQAVEEAQLQGKHLCVLKSRRRGYSYKAASMMCRNYYLIPNTSSYVYASNKQYLTDDGVLTKSWNYMDFIDEHTAWGKKRSVNTQLRRRAGMWVKDEYGNQIEVGYKSEIIGVTLKDNPDVGHPYDQIVYTPEGKKKWEDITVGSKLFDSRGDITTVTEVNELGKVPVYKLTLSDGRTVEATADHKWRVFRYRHKQHSWNGKNEKREIREIELTTEEIFNLTKNKSYKTNRCRIKTRFSVPFNNQEVPVDAYTMGFLLGDGSLTKTSNHKVYFVQSTEDYESIKHLFPYKVDKQYGITYAVNIPNAKQIIKELNLLDKTSDNKFIPDCYKYNSEEIRLAILNGLLDTDGSVTKDYGVIEYVSKSYQLAQDVRWLLFSLGINNSLHVKYIKQIPYYRVYIYCSGKEDRLFCIPRKKERIAIKKLTPFALSKVQYIYIDKVERIEDKVSKCVTVDAEDHVYMIGDFIETKNCRGKRANLILFEEAGSFKELSAAWQIARPSVEIDGRAFATMIAYGTGGDEESNFFTLKDMFYHPEGYNCLALPNIWDENVSNTECGFFVPQYTNMDLRDEQGKRLYMDKDGNTLTIPARQYILEERRKVIENSTNSVAVDRYVAERPITPAEACLEFNGNIFPKKELQEQLGKIRTNKLLSNHKQVGDLIWESDGSLKWLLKKNGDITHYPLNKNDDPTGSIVIWEHPVKDAPIGLYIIGVDPYDHDQSGTNSLGSCFVYKRFQNFENYYDLIVAEYTGRPSTAEEFYENVRKLAIYYNARIMYENQNKGLFPYFVAKHCDYLLADQPDILNDIIGNSKVNRKKGCHMNKQIKQWGEGLIKDWLNDEKAPGHKNLHDILSEPLLEELISYNDIGNFDRCLTKDTLITTESGYKKVQDIKVGDKVLTHTGQLKSVTWIDKHIHNEFKAKLRLIGDYRTLECTDNHPILVAYTDKVKHNNRVKALNNIQYLRADQLTYKYQFGLLPKRKLNKQIDLSADILYVLGWIMSDGYVPKTSFGVKITFQGNQLEEAKRCLTIIEDYLKDEDYYIDNNHRRLKRKPTRIESFKNGVFKHEIIVHSRKLHDLALWFGCEANNKHINDEVYNSYNNLMPFVIGWLEGDGHQRLNVNYDGYTRNGIELSTIYEKLIHQCRQILLDSGIYSSIRKVPSRRKNHQTQYSILISNEYINKLLDFYPSLKYCKITVNRNTSKVLETTDGFWVPIKLLGLEKINEEVYNFEVQDDHTYIANGIATHNCMALIQVMIYREQLYNVVVKEKKKQNKSRLLFDGPIFNEDSWYDDIMNNVEEDVYTFN